MQKSTHKQERQKLYSNPQWKNLRKIYRQSHPLCEECLKHDIVTPASDIHHKLSPFDPNIGEMEQYRRLLDWNNLKALCKECHANLHNEQEKAKKAKKNPQKGDKT
ncbi:MAG: HNH endonuclease [Alphaproteobacteria bacterium]|nr:HNH endonuclease [Alphaproteobacteria bacterium]